MNWEQAKRAPKTANEKAFIPFQPHLLVRDGHLQTLLARIRPADKFPVVVGEQPILVEAGYDYTRVDPDRSVRLLGFYTAHKSQGTARGLVMLLHGWEGCSHSNYNLIVGSALVQMGYDVLRLNLRDHGPTHHLNRGFFYATLLEEVVTATQQVACWAGDRPFYIIGPSLGGNFALRLALHHTEAAFHNLRLVIAINPVLNPTKTSDLLEHHHLYHFYFRRRWLKSLHRKQELFPDLYDFAPLEQIHSIRAMTEWMVQKFGPYANAQEYLDGYAVKPAAFEALSVQTTILTAADDPIIPADDFRALPDFSLLHVHLHPYGGHVGYTDIFPIRHRLPQFLLSLLSQVESEGYPASA